MPIAERSSDPGSGAAVGGSVEIDAYAALSSAIAIVTPPQEGTSKLTDWPEPLKSNALMQLDSVVEKVPFAHSVTDIQGVKGPSTDWALEFPSLHSRVTGSGTSVVGEMSLNAGSEMVTSVPGAKSDGVVTKRTQTPLSSVLGHALKFVGSKSPSVNPAGIVTSGSPLIVMEGS
jgi:hypothetical protein